MTTTTDIIVDEENISKCDKFVLFSNSIYRIKLKEAVKLIEDNWKRTIQEFVRIGRIHNTIDQGKPTEEPLDFDVGTNWYHCFKYTNTNNH